MIAIVASVNCVKLILTLFKTPFKQATYWGKELKLNNVENISNKIFFDMNKLIFSLQKLIIQKIRFKKIVTEKI